MLRPGDFVHYVGKNELGVVKSKNPYREDTYFCWWHMGGTAASTPLHIVKKLTPQQVAKMSFSNDYAVDSLIRRRLRVLYGGDVSDYIDSSDL